MKNVLSLAAALSVTASVAFAGGPVVVADEPEVEVVQTTSSSKGALLPILLGVVVIAAVAGGDGS